VAPLEVQVVGSELGFCGSLLEVLYVPPWVVDCTVKLGVSQSFAPGEQVFWFRSPSISKLPGVGHAAPPNAPDDATKTTPNAAAATSVPPTSQSPRVRPRRKLLSAFI